MTIVTLGCSFTDCYHRDINPWPKVIENKTGIPVINYGISGSGNKYSFDAFINHLKNDKEVDTVYWLMTEFDRMDTIGLWKPKVFNRYFTLKPYATGKNPENFLNKWISAKSKVTGEVEKENQDLLRIKREIRLGRIMYENISPLEFFDYNLMLIHLTQKVCKEYGIKLKIASGLRPLYTHDSEEISYILKSKYNKNIDFSSIIGYPFYKEAAGMCVVQVKNWDTEYSISPTDNHPGQKGSDFIADLFLGEKNILDYR